jgi:hypothetical protein
LPVPVALQQSIYGVKMFLPCRPQFSGKNNAHWTILASMLFPSSMLFLAPMLSVESFSAIFGPILLLAGVLQ